MQHDRRHGFALLDGLLVAAVIASVFMAALALIAHLRREATATRLRDEVLAVAETVRGLYQEEGSYQGVDEQQVIEHGIRARTIPERMIRGNAGSYSLWHTEGGQIRVQRSHVGAMGGIQLSGSFDVILDAISEHGCRTLLRAIVPHLIRIQAGSTTVNVFPHRSLDPVTISTLCQAQPLVLTWV